MIKNILLAILGAAFIAAFAQIEIEVPLNKENLSISGQTFAVLLAAFFLGRWYGLLAVVIYLVAGFLGLPVFLGGASGIENLYDGSGGYLVGFLIAASTVGDYGDHGWRRSLPKCFAAMLIGTLIILLFGVLKLLFNYGIEEALQEGFYPFIWGGLVKVVLGALIAFGLEKLR